MAYQSASTTVRIDLIAQVTAYIADLKDAWARYSVYRETMDELRTLSARELADLGLSKSGIRAVAYEAAYGE